MKVIFSFLLIILLTLVGISCQQAVSSPTQSVTKSAEEAPRISLEDAKKDFDAGTAVFVDSRPATTYKQNHIKGAINILLSEVDTRWKEIPTDKKIIVYCS